MNDYKIFVLKHLQFIMLRSFESFPKGSVLEPPFLVRNPVGISIGRNVLIRKNARFEIINEYAGVKYNGKLDIGDGTIIENDVHIVAASEVVIGDKVLIAPRVTIVDSDHGFEETSKPIMDQPLKLGTVSIGDGTWIGTGATILKGTIIGKNCVIGAGAIVKGIIPDFSVVVGMLATRKL
ncbi:acyltransferase [Alicyclobacillus tolerans]|uniref:acyltransferase n=1 Tax=Alicyclobacillus tolerans TaxID=90970 RepID=UPI001F1A3BBA|nr:acyltransferase [Alicyclobacillus tolerans]MCF8567689.1 acyltransferase [Alicyclobacillus tolerans]